MKAEANRRQSKGWGMGCLAMAAMTLLVLSGLGGWIAFELGREPDPQSIEHSQTVPAFDPALRTSLQDQVAEPGRVVLDVEGIALTIVPGPADSVIQLDGDFDAEGFDFDREYSTYGNDGWVYRIELRPAGAMKRIVHGGRTDSSLRITLPRDVPIALEGFVGVGETRIDLGGLWIVSTELKLGQGEHQLDFSEPLLHPMESLVLDARVGEITLVELGNASPRQVHISKAVGEACVDLRGAWQANTTLEMACGAGSCDLHRPREDEAIVTLVENTAAALRDATAHPASLPRIDVNIGSAIPGSVEISESLTTERDGG
jgi:hypothetical protein